jgi:hypothetical protein
MLSRAYCEPAQGCDEGHDEALADAFLCGHHVGWAGPKSPFIATLTDFGNCAAGGIYFTLEHLEH